VVSGLSVEESFVVIILKLLFVIWFCSRLLIVGLDSPGQPNTCRTRGVLSVARFATPLFSELTRKEEEGNASLQRLFRMSDQSV